MSTTLREPPDLSAGAGSGIVARRAVIRWAVRLFRREWRQQLLIIAMLTMAVAAMTVATSVAASTRGESARATFGAGNAIVTLPGTDPRLGADIAAIGERYGPADVIEGQHLRTGTNVQATLRAQDPRDPLGKPMLALVSGSYPAGPGQVALTAQLASLYQVPVGGTWRYGSRDWRVTGIVENPSNLLEQFALVAPGQLARPDRVSVLLDVPGHVRLTGLPAAANVVTPDDNAFQAGPSPAVVVLVISVIGLVFIGLMAVAGFAVVAQRRLRALGMLSSLGATEGDVRLVMVADGAVTGIVAAVIGSVIGSVIGFGAWFAYAPHLQAAVAHVVDPLAVPWPVITGGIALRDLVRYRARSGAALGAVSLAVFLATATCLVASFRFANPLDWTGPNLAPNELLVRQAGDPGQAEQPAVVRTLAGQLHATSVLALDQAGLPGYPGSARLWQVRSPGALANDFSGDVYVATPALLARYGIKPSQIAPGTDILTMRPGLAAEPRMELTICPDYGTAYRARLAREGLRLPPCPPRATISDPTIQTISGLPSGTSEPNTLITMHAVHQMGLRTGTTGWLIQASAPLAATQVSDARAAVVAADGQIATKSDQLSITQIGDGASAAGLCIALAMLAMSIGLVRSETAGDLRTLAAAGASARTRRAITAATAGALSLLGVILGASTACLAVIAWAHGSLGAVFTNVPGIDYLLILAGLPLAATAGGWLLAGREPPAIARQPIE